MATDGNPRACTVTHGRSSFIGRSLVAALIKSGEWTVRIADPLPPLPDDPFLSDWIQSGRASYRQLDLTDRSQARSAAEGSSVVFHVDPATTALSPHRFHSLYLLVVQGARNLIAACIECGVERLVYTGSADVVFDGVHDVRGGDESLPYPDKFEDELSELRAQAEAMVLSANGRGGLSTCALRPSNPFGPGDEDLVPFLARGAKCGWLKFIIGNGKNMSDFTYVENVARANICAEQALYSKMPSVPGKPFFITNNEPVELWAFVSKILEGLQYQRPRFHIPFKLVLLMILLIKWVRNKYGFCENFNSHLTPTIVRFLSCTKTFDCSKAQRHIGYTPIVSLQEGITSTVESFPESAKGIHDLRMRGLSKPSKAYILLGSGSVADILLWRDDKKTFTWLLALFLFVCWFLSSGRSFLSSAAELLLLVSVTLFIHGILPSSLCGYTVEKISSSHFDISESDVRRSFNVLASLWNGCIGTLKSLTKGDDWNIFFKAAGFLFLVKLLLPIAPSVLITVGLICMFSLFIVYEQFEEETEKLMAAIVIELKKLKEKLLAKLAGLPLPYVQKNRNIQ